ncbi:alpha/beta hydrolase [Streptomyces sp. NPDC001698]|uniref:alpha/beta hydrolase n=1 Tax=Streptomyces sp. NPDC001698 TaxID=3364601 RepID=UPI0036CB3F6C
MRMRYWAGLALLLSVGVAGTGCSGSQTPSGPAARPLPVDAGKDSWYAGQKLSWRPCPQLPAARCATLTVPVDYARPNGARLQLAVEKLPASGKKRGSLVVNPGGPGIPGRETAPALARLAPAVHAHYDIVGFDPRGVGGSSQLHCLNDAAHDAYYATDRAPDSRAGKDRLRQQALALAKACQARAGALLAHMGTAEAARDMDVLRAALSEADLNYAGFSYGTLLGQYYAERYPEHVGRMYLDSVMDPARTLPEIIIDDVVGAQKAYEAFLAHCTKRPSCPLGDDQAAADRRITQLVTRLNSHPLAAKTDPARPVTGSDLRDALVAGLTSEQGWPSLVQALASAERGDVTAVRALADDAHGRARNGVFSGADESFLAVACAFATREQRSDQALDRAVAAATAMSPLFGPIDSFRPCAHWPAASAVTAHPIKTTTGPILLANNTGDPSTPLAWAQSAARNLHGSVLVTHSATSHGFVTLGPCPVRTMSDYLVSGTIPRTRTPCTNAT